MTESVDDRIFAELRKIDTPTITNVVATYPKNPLCLGLYNPWTENWYTDTSIRCIYPEMGAIVGHAVTCVYGLPDPNYAGRLSFMDVIDALDAMKKPTIWRGPKRVCVSWATAPAGSTHFGTQVLLRLAMRQANWAGMA